MDSTVALHQWLTETQARMHEWAAQADESCLNDLRPDNPWHEGMRGWLLLHHAYQDELHHRGQLYAIARVLGLEPPMPFAEENPAYWDPRKGK
ncbi:MAG TPA: DinB family protein [Symbiobacteriaceae bacterium]|nr:DinB family protein [Symbiobacteriaceae bacterium]